MKPPKTFTVDTADGQFTFRWRDMATQVAVERLISELTGGQSKPAPALYWLASTTALFRTLVAEVPEGFVFDDLDPVDPDTYNRLQAIVEAHSKAEKTFRQRVPARPEDVGQARSDQPAV